MLATRWTRVVVLVLLPAAVSAVVFIFNLVQLSMSWIHLLPLLLVFRDVAMHGLGAQAPQFLVSPLNRVLPIMQYYASKF